MTIKIVFLILCLAIVNNAKASDSIADYYSLVNESELLICSNQLEQAISHYDLAFTYKKMPSGKDLYNAWICAYILNDTTRFKRYSIDLIKCGAFKHETVHENLLNQVQGGPQVSSFAAIWVQLKKEIKAEVDTGYVNTLNTFLDNDQEVRHFFQKQCGEMYNSCGRDSLNTFDSLNVKKLFDFFALAGFPTVLKGGYNNQFPTNSPSYVTILLHDRQWTGRSLVDSFLYTKVLSGDFPPRDYALLKNKNYRDRGDSISSYQEKAYSFFATDLCYKIDDKLYFTNYEQQFSKEKTANIETARKSIFMDSIKESIVKMQFQSQHSWFIFYGPDYTPSFDGIPENIIDRIKNEAFKEEAIDGFNNIGKQRCKYGLSH